MHDDEIEWPPGTAERTDESVCKVRLSSLERGTITRYLSPGDVMEAPTDHVEVRALQPENPGDSPSPRYLIPLDETDDNRGDA